MADETWEMVNSDWRSVGGEGYTGVEGLEGGEQAASEGGVDWAPHQKSSHQGSVLTDNLWWGSYLSWGDQFGVGKGGVEVEEVHDQAACKGGWTRAPHQKLCHWGLVLAGNLWQRVSFEQRGSVCDRVTWG